MKQIKISEEEPLPVLNMSKFIIRKVSIQTKSNSDENKEQNRSSDFSNEGWVASQFDPDLDSDTKKEIYVITKMIEMQFDIAVAKSVLQQIDVHQFTREEIL